jgi:hypothetical protein
LPPPEATDAIPLLIADGDIPTTRLVARELRAVYPDVEVRIPDTLFGADARNRPILVSRLCHPSLRWLPAYLGERGHAYAYFLDDNFWELTPEVDPHLAAFFGHPAVLATLDAFVRGSRRVIVWSARLGDYVRGRFPGHDVVAVDAGFDVDAVRAPLAAAAAMPPSTDGVFRVGYPTTRKPALAPLLCALVAQAEQHFGTKVQFEFMGWMPEALGSARNATLLPQIDDYASYLAFMIGRSWGAGIAPLLPGRFESFKTDIKYREYGGCRIAGVYSDVPPYTDAVDNGRTGLLVRNDPAAWLAVLARLQAAPAERAAIAATAFADVSTRRDLHATGRRLAAALPGWVGR